MDETQRDKQMRAAARVAGAELRTSAAAERARVALEARIKEAASGNPGLQAILSRPLLAGETEAAIRGVGAVESYLQSGEVPTEASAAAEFFAHVSLTAFKDILTPAGDTATPSSDVVFASGTAAGSRRRWRSGFGEKTRAGDRAVARTWPDRPLPRLRRERGGRDQSAGATAGAGIKRRGNGPSRGKSHCPTLPRLGKRRMAGCQQTRAGWRPRGSLCLVKRRPTS